MNPRPLRVALIGYGYAGRTIHAPLIRSADGLELVAVGSSRADEVRTQLPGVRVEADYMKLATSPDIDLVVIATPNDTHHPLAHAALTSGRHVIVDKPFAVTLAQADELVALSLQTGRLLSVFHNRRWDGDFLSLQTSISSGELGDVREFVSRFDRFDPVPRDRWRERDVPGGGLWHDLGPHLIDQALVLFGLPDAVQADLACLRDGEPSSVDYAQVCLHYRKRRVTLHCTRLSGWQGARFEAHGTKGSFHSFGLDVQEPQMKAGLRPGEAGWGEDDRPVYLSLGPGAQPAPRRRIAGAYMRYFAGVRDAIVSGGPNPVPPDQAREVMRVLELAIESSNTGRTLALG